MHLTSGDARQLYFVWKDDIGGKKQKIRCRNKESENANEEGPHYKIAYLNDLLSWYFHVVTKVD